MVRVSRRVGGAADLLATGMQAVPERHSVYEPAPLPVGAKARDQGLADKPQTSPRPSVQRPTVRCVNRRRNAASEDKVAGAESLRITDADSPPTIA